MRIINYAFTPRSVTVPVGTTVTVVNEDEPTHDWTSDSGAWTSGELRKGQAFSFTFTTAGTFGYLCTIHPSMTGSITVTQ